MFLPSFCSSQVVDFPQLVFHPREDQSIVTPAQVPRIYLDIIYKDIPSTTFVEEGQYYSVPCSTKLNVSTVGVSRCASRKRRHLSFGVLTDVPAAMTGSPFPFTQLIWLLSAR